MSIDVDMQQIRRLQDALDDKGKKIDLQMKIAVNATAKAGKRQVSAAIRKELATTKKEVDRRIKYKLSTAGQITMPSAQIRIKESNRISLKYFKPRQTRRGTSYRISKTRGGGKIKGAFMGPNQHTIATKLYGHVFQRAPGAGRTPIVKQYGPSPWGVFKKRGMKTPIVIKAKLELHKQIEKRIRTITRKKLGKFK